MQILKYFAVSNSLVDIFTDDLMYIYIYIYIYLFILFFY